MAAYGKKAQTEKKAKGLVGWENGKPSKTAPNKVGDYKGKTLNLTNKQLGKAGTAAAQKRTVNISNTKYDTGSKKVLGPAGKPLTGKVDLGGGNMAVYKNGVRVRAAAKKTTKPSSSATSKPQKTTTTVTPKQRGEDAGSRGASTSTAAGTPNKNMLNLGRAAKPTNAKQFIPYAGTRKPTGKEIGPGVLGVRAPKDGQQYRFGPPRDVSVYRWDAKTKKFVYVKKA